MLVNTEFVSIGAGVTIRPGARIECVRTKGARDPELTIGDFTSIEQNAHLICRSRVRIGRSVTITGNCAIVDVVHSYEDVNDPRSQAARIDPVDRPVEIDDFSFIGFGSVILPGVRVGKRSVVAAKSVVTRDVPDYCVAAGAPARVIRRYDPVSHLWLAVKS